MSKRRYLVPAAVFLAILIAFRRTFAPFLAGAAIAYVLDMPMRCCERLFSGVRRVQLRRALAVSAALFGTLSFTFLFAALLVPRITESAGLLSARLPGYWAALISSLDRLPIPDAVRRFVSQQGAAFLEQLKAAGNGLLSEAWRLTRHMGGAVAASVSDIFTALVSFIYLLCCKSLILSQCRKLFSACLPAKVYQQLRTLFGTSNEIFSRYISGRVIESAILTVLCLVGLLLSGIPYAPLLSLISGVSNLIPFLGPLLGVVPCVLLLVVIDPVKAVWFAVFILALQQLDNNLISPRIVGTSVGLPAVWTMLSVLLGARILGTAGAFLAVPCAAVAYRLLGSYLRTRT